MAPDGQKLETPTPEKEAAPKVNPEQPVVAAAQEAHAKEADAVAKDNVEAPKVPEAPKPAEPAKPAEAPEVTADNPEGLPKNDWTDSYYALKKQLTDNPEMNGPLMQFALASLRLAAKYAKYMDMLPGAFAKSVSDSDVTIEKDKADKLADEHLKFLKKTKEEKDKAEAETKKALVDLEAAEKAANREFGAEKASIKFVTRMLWNNDEFEDSKTLSSSLLNTQKFGEPLYKQSDKGKLAEQASIEEGTLIVFIPNPKTAEKVVAYATGTADEFKYYDVTDPASPIKTFKLKEKDSIINKMEVQTLMVLVPNVQAYKDSKEVISSEDAEKKTQAAFDKIKADNESVAKDIVENKANPNADKLESIKKTSLANFTEADKIYTDMSGKANADEVNVETLAKVEAAALEKRNSPAATEKDRSDYDEAAKRTLAARKFQENLAKLKEIRDAAKKNCDDVGVEIPAAPVAPAPAAPITPQPATAPGVQASVPLMAQTPVASEPSKESKAAWETVKGWAGSVLNLFKTK